MASNKAATWIAFGQVVRRNLTTSANASTTTKSLRAQTCHHISQFSPLILNRPVITHTSIIPGQTWSQNRHFSCGLSSRTNEAAPNASSDGATKSGLRKPIRPSATSDPLRKVAAEAQRSSRQNLVRGSGRLRHVDPEARTKDVTAYCAAEEYDLFRATDNIKNTRLTAIPFPDAASPQVLHLQVSSYPFKQEDMGVKKATGSGDVFVFSSGCVVGWNVPSGLMEHLVDKILPTAAGEAYHPGRREVEDLEYIEDPGTENSQIVGETIILGTKVSSVSAQGAQDGHVDVNKQAARDMILTKIAFSSALARSTKLAVLENRLATYFYSTRDIPATLSLGTPLRITRSKILRKTGELLSIRAQLNLYSDELTDSLPDLFWDFPHSLGLEGYYDQVGQALDVGVRIKALNEKMDYASEIASVLRERLSEKHSSMLEWMIIGLICIEVGFGMVHLAREKAEMTENGRLREMAEEWLEKELGKSRR